MLSSNIKMPSNSDSYKGHRPPRRTRPHPSMFVDRWLSRPDRPVEKNKNPLLMLIDSVALVALVRSLDLALNSIPGHVE